MTDVQHSALEQVLPPRNLIVAFDGTNNEFGSENTNIVRLVQSLDRTVQRQLFFYDPGVGTFPEPGFVTSLGKGISTLNGLAFGAGLGWKVRQAYQFLMQRWRPKDQVFVYGFSRGAYSARVLAAFLHMFGLLSVGNESLLPYAYRLFKASRQTLESEEDERSKFWFLVKEFRETFGRDVPERTDRRFPVRFIGVWDTVSSVGWVWNPLTFPYTACNPSVAKVRHAISIDERRWFFRQNQFTAADGQDLQELWFPGVHCDVGGGYSVKEGGLWQEPFRWILEESKEAGLIIDAEREALVWRYGRAEEKPWRAKKHESLKWYWWPAEFIPKLQYQPKLFMSEPAVGLGSRRTIAESAVPHPSTILRLADRSLNYKPLNIPERWLTLEVPSA